MIKLRVVGSSNDLENLVLTSRKQGRRGSHVLAIDDRLFRLLEDVVRKRRAKDTGRVRLPAAEPKLAPREVQRLLRAGRPVEQVAKLAGMDVPWVERFLGPVLDERAGAIRESQAARVEKPRLGRSNLPLGDAVARNLRARRVRLTDEELAGAWDASRADGAPWTVAVTFPYRGRQQRAVWRYDPRTGDVVAANRLGGDLGWVGDLRRTPPSRPPAGGASAASLARTPRARSVAKRGSKAASKRKTKPTARKRPSARKPAARKRPPARKPAARRPVPRKPAARRRRAPARGRTRRASVRRR